MSEAAVIELITMIGAPQPSDEEWSERAVCAQTDPDAFFPEKGGSTKEAKKICNGCPVMKQCREWALDNDERFGIWGGLSERERRRLKRGVVDDDPDEEPCVTAIASPSGDCDQDARLAG